MADKPTYGLFRPPSWLNVKEYDKASKLDGLGWFINLAARMDLWQRTFDYQRVLPDGSSRRDNKGWEFESLCDRVLGRVIDLPGDTALFPVQGVILTDDEAIADEINSSWDLWDYAPDNPNCGNCGGEPGDLIGEIEGFELFECEDCEETIYVPLDKEAPSQPNIRLRWHVLEKVELWINLGMDRAQIIQEFTAWLDKNHKGVRKSKRSWETIFFEWYNSGILAYCDLTIWANCQEGITQEMIGTWLYHQYDKVDGKRRQAQQKVALEKAFAELPRLRKDLL